DDGGARRDRFTVTQGDHDGVPGGVDADDLAVQPDDVAKFSGEGVGHLGHPTDDPLLADPAVDGDQRFHVDAAVGTAQTLGQGHLGGTDTEGALEDPGEPGLTAGGAQVAVHPATQVLVQP